MSQSGTTNPAPATSRGGDRLTALVNSCFAALQVGDQQELRRALAEDGNRLFWDAAQETLYARLGTSQDDLARRLLLKTVLLQERAKQLPTGAMKVDPEATRDHGGTPYLGVKRLIRPLPVK